MQASPRKRSIQGLLSASFLFFAVQCFGVPVVLDSAIYFVNGHTYYLLQNSTWTEAESQATELGGHLVTVNDAAENLWIANQWGATRSLWIGFNDAAVEGIFQWTSGELVGYTNWRAGEPNNGVLFGANEDWTYIMAAGFGEVNAQWNDYQNLSSVGPEPLLYGVVEVVPEPSSAALVASGIVIGILRWRSTSTRKQG